ncbi:MAG: SDR family oxidoreductase [Rhodospirillaceae bacterium]|jgi:NAD(P)-dependent dehydrogenase (short-subunit alcohol dehydrogenase family)|nr:SDR family oxidoreductase [Rhodospirillaceae bacterium]MBT4489024.1 SDR family oxidoreductase [Rhodospirillaceae bacterium]MBT5194623.1 SDR family oxidoreductase [Rhodospirillaceae bacterium]MBT5896486.1 SDR family oxidoreductase [Rhodospirillaceae bacterium]MBT6426640.1 SDR family oxidoreductase [Rhodospirillaceae bacterium]
MSKRLEGQSALVTGAAAGIGRAIAVRLASEGARVLVADINGEGAAETAREIGASASVCHVDVTQRSSIAAMVAEAVARHGRLDVTVSNAGIMDRMPFLEMTDDFWNKVIGLNLSGAFMCGQESARQMVSQGGGGRIVFVASNSGLFGGRGRAAYGASKAGLMNLTQSMAIELAEHNIRVNAVGPGPTKTRDDQGEVPPPSVMARMPMARFGDPQEVAAVAAFLAAEESSFVTGHTYFADGGYTVAGMMEG